MIRGLFEAHVPVRDLDRSVAFYLDVVGLTLGTRDDARRIAFCFAGGWNHTMVGLWEKPLESISTQHLAFDVALDDLRAAIDRLKCAGVQPLNFFNSPRTFRRSSRGCRPSRSTFMIRTATCWNSSRVSPARRSPSAGLYPGTSGIGTARISPAGSTQLRGVTRFLRDR